MSINFQTTCTAATPEFINDLKQSFLTAERDPKETCSNDDVIR